MGTRSTTRIYLSPGELTELDREDSVVIYRQMDGYLSGHGKQLAEFLQDFVVVNGIPFSPQGKIANGMSCLAAQIVAHFKFGVGNIYLHTSSAEEEEYNYIVYFDQTNGS